MAETARGLTILLSSFATISLLCPVLASSRRSCPRIIKTPYPQKEGQKRAKNDKKNNPVSNLLV